MKLETWQESDLYTDFIEEVKQRINELEKREFLTQVAHLIRSVEILDRSQPVESKVVDNQVELRCLACNQWFPVEDFRPHAIKKIEKELDFPISFLT